MIGSSRDLRDLLSRDFLAVVDLPDDTDARVAERLVDGEIVVVESVGSDGAKVEVVGDDRERHVEDVPLDWLILEGEPTTVVREGDEARCRELYEDKLVFYVNGTPWLVSPPVMYRLDFSGTIAFRIYFWANEDACLRSFVNHVGSYGFDVRFIDTPFDDKIWWVSALDPVRLVRTILAWHYEHVKEDVRPGCRLGLTPIDMRFIDKSTGSRLVSDEEEEASREVVDNCLEVEMVDGAGRAGTMRFVEGEDVSRPNFMDLRFHVDDIGGSTVTSDKYRSQLIFVEGDSVKAFSLGKGGKKKPLSGYGEYEVLTVKSCGREEVEEAIEVEEVEEVDERVGDMKGLVDDLVAWKESRGDDVESIYEFFSSRAGDEGFTRDEIDSMEYPEHVMFFGTTTAVERKIGRLGAGDFDTRIPNREGDLTWPMDAGDWDYLDRKTEEVGPFVDADGERESSVDAIRLGDSWALRDLLFTAIGVVGAPLIFRTNGEDDSPIMIQNTYDICILMSPVILDEKG